MLGAANATANSAADQLAVVDLAVAHCPRPTGSVTKAATTRGGRSPDGGAADSAGAVAGFVAALVEPNIDFSVYARDYTVNDAFHQAIWALGDDARVPAMGDDEGQSRHRGEVAELDVVVAGWPAATRAMPGARRPIPALN